MNFDLSSLGTATGAAVMDAKVELSNFQSGSCSGAPVRMSRITSAWSLTGLTWGNQPTVTTDGSTTTEEAYGNANCPDEGWVDFDATAIVSSWLDGAANNGVRFKTETESAAAGFRKYRSADNGDITKAPKLTVTLDQAPATPTGLSVSPGTGYWTRSKTPTITATVTDPDGGAVAGYVEVKQGSTLVWSGTSSTTTSGGKISIDVPAGKLVEGNQYGIAVYGEDPNGRRSSSPVAQSIMIDTIAPTATMTSPQLTNNTWDTSAPSSATFNLAGSADTLAYSINFDGIPGDVGADSAGGYSAVRPVVPGWHVIEATPIDWAGNRGPKTTFSFGAGAAGFTTPVNWTPSAASFPVDASGPPSATAASLQWRIVGEATWRTATKVIKPDGTAWTGTITAATGRSTTGGLIWQATEEPFGTGKLHGPVQLELRGCFTYTAGSSCTAGTSLFLITSAFGDRFPVTDLGPAQVGLITGEAIISDADAADSAAGLGRTFASLSDGTLTGGVFGPGWSDAQTLLPSVDAKSSIVDNRTVDGTFIVIDPGSGTETFQPVSSGSTTYVPAQPTGDATKLVYTAGASGAPDTLVLSRPLGAVATTTTWELKASDTGGTPEWTLVATDAPGTANDLTVTNTGQRPTWIRESDPTAATTCNATTQTVGCRGLKITYTGTGTATRVTSVDRVIGAATQTAVNSKTLASYSYDTTAKLSKVCGPDPDGAGAGVPLCTEYTYTTVASRTMLATLKPAGLTEWRFGYDTIGRLTTVKRARPAASGGGDATWSIDYNLTPTSSGLPDMTASKLAEWGQQTIPTRVFAVYEPDTGTADVTKADLIYSTVTGITTNTASYGPSGWLVDTSWFDAKGDEVQHLDPTGWARVQAAPAADRPRVAAEASSYTVYNTWGPTDVVGTRVVDEYGPAHTAVLEDGTAGYFRTHTHSMYDDSPDVDSALIADRPGTDGLGLVVKETSDTVTAARIGSYDEKVTKYGYAPVAAGDGNGWNLGAPTTTSTKVDSSTWSTETTRFDTTGRQIETRQPGGAATAGVGTDAHATVTSYYTATGTGDCGGKPDWAGLTCKEGPAAQPAGQPMPTTYYNNYDSELRPATVQQISSGVVNRTTSSGYDDLGRAITSTIATSGTGVVADSITTTNGYDIATGLPNTVTSAGATITTSYDAWGRETGYIDATGNTAATTYDGAGQVSTRDDGATVTTYSFGSHGELNTVTASGGIGTFTYHYAPDGSLAKLDYPDGITAKYEGDEIGTPTGVEYADSTGTMLSFTATNLTDGRTTAQSSAASSQDFDYDDLGRLAKVEDTRNGACTTRTYGFSAASERTSYKSYMPTSSGNCQTTTGVDKTSIYDSATRITNSGYIYDTLGRTLTVPAADTGSTSASALSADYRANDMVKSMTQDVVGTGGTETRFMTYTLDPAGRIDTITTRANGSEVQRLRYRYGGASDAPTSIQESDDSGATWQTTTFQAVPGLGLLAESIASGTTYELSDLHGNLVATVTDNGSLASYSEATEYGVSPSDSSSRRYAWLGSAQRSATDSLGNLILMGARLYNPATGQFLTPDSVPGGNVTSYTYPLDPVNTSDSTGLSSGCDSRSNCPRMVSACLRYAHLTTCGILFAIIRDLLSYSVAVNHGWDNNWANAGRHFAFVVVAALLIGERGARAIADAHEYGATGSDATRDQFNNNYALGWYSRHKKWARSFVGFRITIQDGRNLYWHGEDLFRRGYLYGLCPIHHGREWVPTRGVQC